MQTRIADELSRTDLSSQIALEITSAIQFFQNERFWFNEDVMVTITTISGQRNYTLPPNFGAVTTVRSQLGQMTYALEPRTIQYLDTIDWGNSFISSYLDYYTLFNGMIRLYPPPVANLPIYIRGTVVLPSLTTTAATKSYATNTTYSVNDTVLDTNGNIQKCVTAGTTRAAPTKTYTANTAYTAGDTVLDLNSNLQTCTTSGTSGYLLALDKTQWATLVNGITPDGTAQWTLTSTQWSTDYNSYTVDGSVVWQLQYDTGNAWTSQGEELIRSRACRMVCQRYIKDAEQTQSYMELEKENLYNLRMKNVGQKALNRITPHI